MTIIVLFLSYNQHKFFFFLLYKTIETNTKHLLTNQYLININSNEI